MPRIAMLEFRVKNTRQNFDGVLLYLASKNPDDLWSRKIAVRNGKGGCQIPAPGLYVLTWYLSGAPGGALKVDVLEDGTLIDTLETEDTMIPEGEVENYGLLEFELEE